MNELPRLRLRELQEESLYQVDGMERPISGQALMCVGIKLLLKGDFQSKVV
ncbi:GH36 C-terminal domain-containing protein [Paenibacillus paridis]|uniref:GH36 C-terminal domain-containing protein n=1 Tax=Paenibacillus paridis TaxID=2583376 RepID=UPI00111DA56D